jgi:outer membrane protein assembly factor BamB
MPSFELIPGASWCEERSRPQGWTVGETPDLNRALDTVDLFVNGVNVAARAGPDAVFCITRDLLVAVRDLALGRRDKATVSFYEGPWELVLLREHETALITFMRVGAAPEVVIQDHPEQLAAIGASLVTAGERLCRCARRLDAALDRDPLIGEIELLGAEVRGALLANPSRPARPIPEQVVYETTNFDDLASAGAEGRLIFGFEITATSRDLLGPVVKGRADLHALLCSGVLVAYADTLRVVVGRGRVFLQVERLLAGLKHLLGAWEQGKPMHVRLHGDTLQVGLRLASDEKVALTLGQVGGGRRAVTSADLEVDEVVRPLLSLAKELRRAMKQLAPQQKHNPRFESFRRDLGFIESWYRDLTRPSLVDEQAEPYQISDTEESDGVTLPPAARVSLTEARRLSYTERWWLEAEGLDIGGTFLCGDRIVVTARDTVMALDRDRGELLWRIEAPPAYSLMAGHYGLVRLGPSGQASLVDLRDGRTRWEVGLRPRAGAPAGAQVGGTHGPRCVVLTEAERGLVALDLNTGEQRWRFAAWRGRDFAIRPAGRLLLVTCGDSAVYGLDAESGELVWRHTARATFEIQTTAFRDRALACGGPPGGRDARLFCTDLASGRLHWVKVLDIGVTGPVVGAAGSTVVVPGRHPSGGAVIVGLDLATGDERWRRWLEGWSDYTMLAVDDVIVTCGSGGLVAAVDARTGDLRWSLSLGYTDPDDVPRRLEPVLRGGALFVPADTVYVVNPRDGSIIHRLGGDGLVPDLLRVDERCGIYVAEEAGYVAAYGVAANLAVVR